MVRANFEEHTAELPYLCQHFRTNVDEGLSEAVYSEKAAELLTKRICAGQLDERPRRCLPVCCSKDFPPPQSGWWLETTQQLVPEFSVLRAGRLCRSPVAELVTGDIVYVCVGQQAPIDARVLVT